MSTSVPPPSTNPQPINELEPLRQVSGANGRTYEASIPDDLHGQRPQSIDSKAAPLSEHELTSTPPHSDATVEPTRSLLDDILTPTKKAHVPSEEASAPEDKPVPKKSDKVSEEPVGGEGSSLENPKTNEGGLVELPGVGEARVIQIQEDADARAEPPVTVDDDDLCLFAEGAAAPGEQMQGELVQEPHVDTESERLPEMGNDPDDLLASADIKESRVPLAKATSLSTSADWISEFAEGEAKTMALPKLKARLITLLPGLKIAERIKATISEIEKNHFESQVNGCRISGRRNGLVFIFGDSTNVKALLENPEAFLSEEDCKLLRDAHDRNQLRCPPPEQEKRIQEMAKEYADQYMQDLEQQIQQEIEALEQKKQQKISTKLPDSPHTEPKIVQGRREELRQQRSEVTPLGSSVKMLLKSQKAFEKALASERREKDKDVEREQQAQEKRYWNTLEDNRKNTIRILDSKIRETQKDDKKTPHPRPG